MTFNLSSARRFRAALISTRRRGAVGHQRSHLLELTGPVHSTLTDGPDQAARLAALEALLGVTSALSGAATPEHVGAAVAEHGARALGAPAGSSTRSTVATRCGSIGYWGDAAAILRAVRRCSRSRLTSPARQGARASGARWPSSARYPLLADVRGGACAPCRCSPGGVLGAVASTAPDGGVPRRRARLLEALGAGSRARARTRALYEPPQPPAGDDRRAGAGADAARGRGHGGGAGRGGARRDERLGGAVVDDRRSLELAHAAGHAEGTRAAVRSLPLDAELPLAEAARTATPLWLESAEAIFERYPRFRRGAPAGAVRGAAAARGRRAALGAIGLVFDSPRTFGPADRDYLLTLTRLCGQALGRARAYQIEHDLAARSSTRYFRRDCRGRKGSSWRCGTSRPRTAPPRAGTSTTRWRCPAGGSGSPSATSSGTGRRGRGDGPAAQRAARVRAGRARAGAGPAAAEPATRKACRARAARPSCTPSSTPARARCATRPPATRRPCSLVPGESRAT